MSYAIDFMNIFIKYMPLSVSCQLLEPPQQCLKLSQYLPSTQKWQMSVSPYPHQCLMSVSHTLSQQYLISVSPPSSVSSQCHSPPGPNVSLRSTHVSMSVSLSHQLPMSVPPPPKLPCQCPRMWAAVSGSQCSGNRGVGSGSDKSLREVRRRGR